MGNNATVARRLAFSFGVIVLLAVLSTIISVYALQRLMREKDHVIDVNAQAMVLASRLETEEFRTSAAIRGYLLTGDRLYLDRVRQAQDEIDQRIDDLRKKVESDEGKRLLAEITNADADYRRQVEALVSMKASGASVDALAKAMTERAMPSRARLEDVLGRFVTLENTRLTRGREDASRLGEVLRNIVLGIAALIVIATVWLARLMANRLTAQLGAAVQDMQSSSTQLQSTATEQATGAREQATALTEITTTISELLATSRQISESAQRVSAVSGEAAAAAGTGERVVRRAHNSVDTIREQVETIVTHMLDLGRKSQQIGTVVDIINELAEQTNILAINANIEAAGAGEAGRRFAVVADEIRKLADRVSGSTKDVRSLVDEVRAAVNTTVMATETGSKAVEAGARQFGEVAEALQQINGLVGTTSEAAREIELSTKQQSTAIEQVNVAVTNVAQVSREAEASTAQAMQTSSELATLARELARLVRSDDQQR